MLPFGIPIMFIFKLHFDFQARGQSHYHKKLNITVSIQLASLSDNIIFYYIKKIEDIKRKNEK